MISKIDVVIAVYNAAPYLERFFESLLSQTFSEFRLFVVYDESEDDSLAILQKYRKIFSENKMRIVFSPIKRGLGAARDCVLNSGLLNCEYLCFLDPDDYINPCFFEKLYWRIQSENTDMVISGFERLNEETKATISLDMVNNPERTIVRRNSSFCIFFNPAVWNKLYRYELVKNLRFGTLERSEDVPYFAEAMLKTDKISFVNEPLYFYMIHQDSLSATYKIEHLSKILARLSSIHNNHASEMDSSDESFLVGLIFIRVCIGSVIRIYQHNKSSIKPTIKLVSGFMKKEFPAWKSVESLSFRECIKNGRKAFYVWLFKWAYTCKLVRLFVWQYVAIIKIRKREVRW